MICDFFIKTYDKDYNRCKSLFLSLGKFSHGFRQVILLIEETDVMSFENLQTYIQIPLKIIRVPQNNIFHEKPTNYNNDERHKKYFFAMDNLKPSSENLKENTLINMRGNGYIMQQYYKLNCHSYSDADFFFILDSDMVFIKKFSIYDFVRDGNIVWYYREYREVLRDDIFHEGIWKSSCLYIFQDEIASEELKDTMFLPPFIFSRNMLKEFESYINKKFKKSLVDVITDYINIPFVSEFNIIGNYILHIYRNEYVFTDDISNFEHFLVQLQNSCKINDTEYNLFLADLQNNIETLSISFFCEKYNFL